MVVANEIIFSSEIHSNRAFQVFQDMRAKEELCDTYLCSGSQRFPAHSVVLAGTCPLFREKLATAQEEIGSTRRYNELEIPASFDKSVVLNVLDFLYEGKLVLNMDHMPELLQLLSYLKVINFVLTWSGSFSSANEDKVREFIPQGILSQVISNHHALSRFSECKAA